MEPVAPIVSLPRPESDRILFDRIVVGSEYYVEYREYIGPAWGQRTMLLLAKVHPDTTSSMVVCWPVWSLGVGNWMLRVTDFSANQAQIDTDNGGREYYHFYRTKAPQEPVGDPTAIAAPVAAGAGAAAAADPTPNNAGDPVAPRRLPSRKRKSSRSRRNRKSIRRRQHF